MVAPWGEITDTIPVSDDFDLEDIQRNGELIALTLTGPETYYDYHGRHLGTQYLLCQRFADKLGDAAHGGVPRLGGDGGASAGWRGRPHLLSDE